jgi:hypothetical protein
VLAGWKKNNIIQFVKNYRVLPVAFSSYRARLGMW